MAHVDEDLGWIDVEDSPLSAVEHGLRIWDVQRGHVPHLIHDQDSLNAILAHLLHQDCLELVPKEEFDGARFVLGVLAVPVRPNLFSIDELEREVANTFLVAVWSTLLLRSHFLLGGINHWQFAVCAQNLSCCLVPTANLFLFLLLWNVVLFIVDLTVLHAPADEPGGLQTVWNRLDLLDQLVGVHFIASLLPLFTVLAVVFILTCIIEVRL